VITRHATPNIPLLVADLLLLLTISAVTAAAQTPRSSEQQTDAQPTVVMQSPMATAPSIRADDLQCTGFIEYAPDRNPRQIVGGEEEQEQNIYAEGDVVYVNAGQQQGVTVGQEYHVVRPRGRFTSKFSKKDGNLGVYTQELGRLRVTEVKDRVSVAVISRACDNILLGDLLRPVMQRVSPVRRDAGRLNRFADPSGKQTGRIVLARDGREMLSRSQIVFIDLGYEDNLKTGQYLTIYRPVGTPNVAQFRDAEISSNASSGFGSDRFRGGKFSNKAQRVQDETGFSMINPPINTPTIKRRRPTPPRKIVGEMVVLDVQSRTATAVITLVAQEIHTGDFVEVQ